LINPEVTQRACLAGICFLLVAMTGCSEKEIETMESSTTNKIETRAFNKPETTSLGQIAASITEGHNGESGFFILDRGRDALSWRMILADAAEKSIDVQYFLWKNDAAGQVLIQRLLDAAERGVRVRALIDDSMTESDPEYLALFGANPNVEVRLYKPFGPKRKSLLRWVDYAAHMKVIDRRMHNKLYVVDASVEIVGGRNIGNEYFEYPGDFVFRSRDLLALGPVVGTSGDVFDMYWNSDWAVPIEDVVSHVPSDGEAAANKVELDAIAADPTSYPRGFYDAPKQIDAEMAALAKGLLWGKGRLLVDDVPDKDGKTQTHAELDRTGVTIARVAAESTSEALIQSAYLILEEGGAVGLEKLMQQGVKVRLATNSMAANNHLSAFASYRKQRKRMLVGGAEVHEMRPDAKTERAQFTAEELAEHKTFFGLHAKTMVFDRKVVFVGSFNLDPRSIDLNTEMGLMVESEALGRAVAESIENDIAAGNSWQVILNDDGKVKWVTVDDGVVTEEFDTDPMTTTVRRAEADALALIPDDSEM
jgi:putative cardiolipin synthase